MRFWSRLISSLFTLLFAHGAYAASTLTVSADKSTYFPGETITLTVTGTINPLAGDAAENIDVRVEFTNAGFVSSTADQALHPPPMFGTQQPWVVGGTQGSFVGNSLTVFGQLCCLSPGGPFVNNHPPDFSSAFITATVLATAGSVGTASFDFGPLTNFFDQVGAAPGVTVLVPEPTTAALMGLGLLGLTAMTRRR